VSDTPSSSPQGAGRFRWTICALLFFATAINYMDRQILGLLAPTLEHEIGWTETEYSHIVMAFQAAYALGLLIFGRIIDSWGTRAGYALAITIWSMAAAGHALARTVLGFGVARVALGFGEAGNFPAAVKAVAEWFPQRERALATGLFNSGANVGAILTPVAVPWLTAHFGWQGSFLALGAVGLAWIALWYWLYQSPERSPRVSAAERAYIHCDPPLPVTHALRWRDVIGHRQTWAYIIGMSLSAPVWWFYLYWLPKFLNKKYGLDFDHFGPPLVVIYSMTCFGSIGGGALSSWLIQRGWSLGASRKTALLVCATCVVPVIGAAQASSVWTATLLIGLAAAAHQGWAANLFTLVSDLFPRRAVASVVGVGAMFGSVMAILFAESTGRILEATGNYGSLFLMCGFAYLVALTIIHLLVPDWQAADLTRCSTREQRTAEV
jgi:ACS family hexuronate transporter-like MFS transporter